MHNILLRRFKKLIIEDNLPEIILVDGGKGHITQVNKVNDRWVYNYNYFPFGGWDDYTAREENLHRRAKNDYRMNAHIIKETISIPIKEFYMDSLTLVQVGNGDKLECQICLSVKDNNEGDTNKYALPCGNSDNDSNEGKHIFHRACIQTWFDKGKSTCPTCRQEQEQKVTGYREIEQTVYLSDSDDWLFDD